MFVFATERLSGCKTGNKKCVFHLTSNEDTQDIPDELTDFPRTLDVAGCKRPGVVSSSTQGAEHLKLSQDQFFVSGSCIDEK